MRYLLLFALFFCIAAPAFWGEGMFTDGTIYASIARNLAEGRGSFWWLSFSSTFDAHFHGHLPLAFYLESLFFRLLGDGIYTERLYSFFIFFLSVLILERIGRKAALDLPSFFWIITPLATWSVANNMLENTVVFFVLMAIISALQTINASAKTALIYSFFSGIMVFAAVLSKSPVGAFPLSIFLWLWLAGRFINIKQAVVYSFCMLMGFALPFFWIYWNNGEAWYSLEIYAYTQLQGGWLQGRATVDSRWYIVGRMLQELIPMGIVALISLWYNRRKKLTVAWRWAAVFGALGLSGVLPIMVSSKQSGFYIVPALPCFALAAAALSKHLLAAIHEFLLNKKLFFNSIQVVVIAMAIGLSWYSARKYSRDEMQITDIKTIIKNIDKAAVSLDPSLRYEWSLYAYMQRYGRVSLLSPEDAWRNILLCPAHSQPPDTLHYTKIDLGLKKYAVWMKD